MNILLIEDNLADQLLTEEAFKKAAGEHVLQCVDDGDKALIAIEHVCKPSSMAEYYSLASKIAEAWTPTAFLIEELGEPHSERFAQRA